MTKKKKDTYYIYYSLMKTLKYYFVVKENSCSIVLYLSRVLIYISAKRTNAKRVLALVYYFTEAKNSLKILRFPRTLILFTLLLVLQ